MGLLTGQIRDQLGNVVATATVNVYTPGTTTPVSLFTNAGLTTPLSQPVSVAADGGFAFYVADGVYDVKISRPGSSDETVPNYPAIDPANYALLGGRSGSQTLNGGTAASERLRLHSTAHGTKGKILLGFGTGQAIYDESTGRLGVGIADASSSNAPATTLDVSGDARVVGKADAVQMTVRGHSTQTTNPQLLLVEKSDGTDVLVARNDGVIQAASVHNSGSAGTGATGSIVSGTYTPTITNIANVAASANATANWLRVGQVVTVCGAVDIDPTTGGIATAYRMSLPVASNLGAVGDLAGNGHYNNGTLLTDLQIFADTTNDQARVDCYSDAGAANRTHTFHFQYRVI